MTRHLHAVVNRETGELLPGCPECETHRDTIAGLNRKLNALAAENTKLRRDNLMDAKDHPMWGLAGEKFDMWRRVCRHPRSVWTADRFWLVEPHLGGPDGARLCDMAIRGAGFDCFRTKRRNGSVQRHDSWELIFRDRGKVEEFANRAPRDSAAEQGKVGASSSAPAPLSRPGADTRSSP